MKRHKTIIVPLLDNIAFDKAMNANEGKGFLVEQKLVVGNYFVAFLSREVQATPPDTGKPETGVSYTFDQMWLAYHKGWDLGYARKPTHDSDSLFEEFLDSLGKNPHVDPLGEERRVMRESFANGDLEASMLRDGYPRNMIDAIKRMCGLEVPHA